MLRKDRKSSRYSEDPKYKGSTIVIVFVIAVLALGVWLIVQGMSFGPDAAN